MNPPANRPRLVLLPGLDGTGMLFGPLLDALPAEIRPTVIAYPRSGRLSLTEHAHHVARQLPPEEIVLLAESFSGLVALALLAAGLPRIKGVLFVAAFGAAPRPLLLRMAPAVPKLGAVMRHTPAVLLREFCLGRDAGGEELGLLREALEAVAPEVLTHRLRLIGARQPFSQARFTVPCHYLRAGQDRLVPATAAVWFEQRFEVCQIDSIDGPHFLLQTRPQACAQWVAERLGGYS